SGARNAPEVKVWGMRSMGWWSCGVEVGTERGAGWGFRVRLRNRGVQAVIGGGGCGGE
ncbi:hypothetical protein KI387_015522, partial [Taxus chinensis]